ncbi:MAG: reprolysin-like metallopeptidase [Bacteroidota bacterium]
MKRHLFLFLCFLGFHTLMAQNTASLWTSIDPTIAKSMERQKPFPTTYKAFQLDFNTIKNTLKTAPLEGNSQNSTLRIAVPGPDGKSMEFDVVEYIVMPKSLQALYPEIRTYYGTATNDPSTHIRLEHTYLGFRAKIRSSEYTWWIEPVNLSSLNTYLGFFHHDANDPGLTSERQCGVDDSDHNHEGDHRHDHGTRNGSGFELLTYRCAFASDNRFTNLHGGVAGAISAITSTVNFINDIYEVEVAIRLTLVPNNNLLIFTDATDPYTANDSNDPANYTTTFIVENPTVINGIIGSANYDLGQVFSTTQAFPNGSAIAGRAAAGSVCTGNKARSVSTTSTPVGLGFYQTMAHETGHQFSARHTFNSEVSNCDGNRVSTSAYEPGDGTTILSYDGCESVGSDGPYFHTHSYQQIHQFSRFSSGSTCPTVTPTTNQSPFVEAGPGGWVIPISTPFVLKTESAFDPDGDQLTYCWEEYDRVTQTSPLNSPVGNSPIFRSFLPTTDSFRYFPRLQDLVNNTQRNGELLPTYTRDLTFRVTVRDNKPGSGGVFYDQLDFDVTDQAGPFVVTTPSGNVPSYNVGELMSIEWDVANTDGPEVNCQTVDIYLSTDGGLTYDIVLAEGVPNNGIHKVCTPDLAGTANRIMVKAADNIFFDISNFSFAINASPTPGFSLVNNDVAVKVCQDGSTPLSFETCSVGGLNAGISVNALGLPTGMSVSASSSNINIGDDFVLNIEASDLTPVGTYNIAISAVSTTGATSVSFIPVEVFPAFTEIPAGVGNSGLISASTRPTLRWGGVTGALEYYVEISDDPSFNTIVSSQQGTDLSFALPLALDGNTTYYWRVSAVSECGNGDFSPIYAFRTKACTQVDATDVPKTIDAFGAVPVTATSVINYAGDAPVDIDFYVKGTHENVNDLSVTIKDPSGVELSLFTGICSNGVQDFDLIFDNESNVNSIPCPPISTVAVKPSQPINFYYGKNPTGDWTLTVKDFANFNGGELTAWGITFCQDAQSSDLSLVNNNPLYPAFNGTVSILSTMLESTSANVGASDITYTIVSPTQNGVISLNGTALNPGDTFTQDDVNNYVVTYTNNGQTGQSDQFTFIIQDTEGGWVGTPTFVISPLTSIQDPSQGLQLMAKPNPTLGMVQLSLLGAQASEATVRILDVKGREISLSKISLSNGQAETQIDLSDLASGLYFLEVKAGNAQKIEKILKN